MAVVVAFFISFAMTPIVKSFAVKIGAMDVPTEKRRVHDHPIPRMGGLAIFIGFLLSVVLFADITQQVQGILLGAIIIVMVGATPTCSAIQPSSAWSCFPCPLPCCGLWASPTP